MRNVFKYILILLIPLSLNFIIKSDLTVFLFPKLFLFPKPILVNDYNITKEGIALGRFLFYDKILSKNRTISCSSCHKQEFAFADNICFSRGLNGNVLNRNTPPIFNLVWFKSLFWDGRAKTIEEQIIFPVSNHLEMDLDWRTAVLRLEESPFYNKKFRKVYGDLKIDSLLVCNAIAQFERTLISNNSKYDRVLQGKEFFNDSEHNGFLIVNDQSKGDCFHCHTTDVNAVGTIGGFSNNGLDNVLKASNYLDFGKGGVSGLEKEIGLFKIPSLRNVALTAPYMHDGRFVNLDEVINFYSEGVKNSINIDAKMQFAHKGGVHLSKSDKRDVIAFLKTLTDSVFINNADFSNPFVMNSPYINE